MLIPFQLMVLGKSFFMILFKMTDIFSVVHIKLLDIGKIIKHISFPLKTLEQHLKN